MSRNPWDKNSSDNQKPNNKPLEGEFFDKGNNTNESSRSNKFSGFGNFKKPDFNNLFKNPKKSSIIIALAVFILWILTGFFVVDVEEEGVITRFGKYVRTETGGLHYKLPFPIEKLTKVKFTRLNKIQVGFNEQKDRKIESESTMLTGDENIVDVNFEVQWKVKNTKDFIFNVRDPLETIRNVSESAMREVIANQNISEILSTGRFEIESRAKEIMQEVLDSYGSGIEVVLFQMLSVDPPSQVIDSFRDVQNAKADKERKINQAMAYKNSLIPQAQGEAEKILQEAEIYKTKTLSLAKGKAKRFEEILAEYSKSKDITKRRIYLETMEQVLQNNKITMIDKNTSKSGIVPLMNLGQSQA